MGDLHFTFPDMRLTSVLLGLLLLAWVGFCQDSTTFNLKPDVPGEVSLELYDMVCTFSYAASGGSSEEWVLEFTDIRGQITCTVARPSPPSYLYFTHLFLAVAGGEIDSVEIMNNNGPVPLDNGFDISPFRVESTSYQGEINVIEVLVIEE